MTWLCAAAVPHNTLRSPAVVISFLVAGLSALLSSLCYSEFATQYPLAGGAYNYISLTLGEYAAWLTVTTLVLVRWHLWAAALCICCCPICLHVRHFALPCVM